MGWPNKLPAPLTSTTAAVTAAATGVEEAVGQLSAEVGSAIEIAMIQRATMDAIVVSPAWVWPLGTPVSIVACRMCKLVAMVSAAAMADVEAAAATVREAVHGWETS